MELTRKQKKKLQEKLLKTGLKIEKEAKIRCPVDTGRLRASINTKMVDDFTVRIGTNVEYAQAVEYGTAAHEIKAKDAEALHWKDEDGEDVFATRVQHPGTEPRPFLRPAVDEVLKGNFKIRR